MEIIGKVCMVRSSTAGVFFGEVQQIDGNKVTMRAARRIWYWDGAATLSQLATEGTSAPENCKFPAAVDVMVFGVSEIIPATEKAIDSIAAVKVWAK